MSLTILAVDDSRTIREMLGHTLRAAGYRVVLAEDGVAGLEALETETPDVIVTDINMPRLDGFGFIEAVRAGGADVRRERAEVVAAGRGLNPVPAHRVAHRAEVHGAQPRVILGDEPIVLGGREHVEPLAAKVSVGGRLEAPHPVGIEQRGTKRDHSWTCGRSSGK